MIENSADIQDRDRCERIRKLLLAEAVSDQEAAILRSKTPAERLTMASQMVKFARQLIRTSIKRRHPDWYEDQINRAVALRFAK